MVAMAMYFYASRLSATAAKAPSTAATSKRPQMQPSSSSSSAAVTTAAAAADSAVHPQQSVSGEKVSPSLTENSTPRA